METHDPMGLEIWFFENAQSAEKAYEEARNIAKGDSSITLDLRELYGRALIILIWKGIMGNRIANIYTIAVSYQGKSLDQELSDAFLALSQQREP